ncbi:hypothetical protein GCM10011354_15800 [Egicoccus halophilus]|uniref:Uncharacterized protein n=1 Tax=Egicoccus halophilus TaxID=1670830 RepID=A0A8J3A9S3_9ACTN|nr:hypothetical protein GCM10011354_15800 [Egicoccus halophilus]
MGRSIRVESGRAGPGDDTGTGHHGPGRPPGSIASADGLPARDTAAATARAAAGDGTDRAEDPSHERAQPDRVPAGRGPIADDP